MFLYLKSLFFDTIFLKKSLTFWGAETPFSSKNLLSIFPRGKSLLNFLSLKIKTLITSWIKAPRRLLMSFLDFKYFSCCWIWNHCFLIPFFWKKSQSFWGAETPFFVKSSPSIFPRGKSLLKLRFFANFVKKLNCSYLLLDGS